MGKLIERCAGIDIGKRFLVCCVMTGAAHEELVRFYVLVATITDRAFSTGAVKQAEQLRKRGLLSSWVEAHAALVWLQARHPFFGLPLTHPVTLVEFAFCLAVGVGFTAAIWLRQG